MRATRTHLIGVVELLIVRSCLGVRHASRYDEQKFTKAGASTRKVRGMLEGELVLQARTSVPTGL